MKSKMPPEYAAFCRAAGVDPNKPISIKDLAAMLVHIAHSDTSWLNIAKRLLEVMNDFEADQKAGYLAICWVLAQATEEDRVGHPLRLAAPLVAEWLHKEFS